MKQSTIALALGLLVAGCGGGVEPDTVHQLDAAVDAAADPAGDPAAAGARTAQATGAAVPDANTPLVQIDSETKVSWADYLAGPWCYVYYEAGGERNDERIDYVFNKDGTLLYQNSSEAPVDSAGTWKLGFDQFSMKEDFDNLRIGPTIWVISTHINMVGKDSFFLGSNASHVKFERGACAREATS